MKSDARMAIAYIAGRIISGHRSSHVYDYARGKFASFDGIVSREQVNIFDFSAGCLISGEGNNSNLSLFHYGESHFIDLKIKGTEFEGFDYRTGTFFAGEINGYNASIFDYESGEYSEYSIE